MTTTIPGTFHDAVWTAGLPAGCAPSVLGALATACGSSGSSASSAAAPGPLSASEGGNLATLLKTAATRVGTVLTDGTGYTLYWFTQDTATSSACNNVCQNNWPPVTGRPKLAAGVSLPGKLGAFIRVGGATQATYDGHPLYTYAGDFEPGDAEGNGLHEYGGFWYAITVNRGS
jgi:predicted lipoprotein with Yx(FWY)xxD motif